MPAADNPLKRPSNALIETSRVIARTVSRVLWRIEFHNTENIPPANSGGFVIASNHQSYFDPVWISIPVKHDIRYLAWDRAFGWPVLGPLIRRLGAMPVRLERATSLATLKRAIHVVRNGAALLIFPEGQREFADGRLLRFRSGAARIAINAGVPVLPVTIVGGNRVWPREFMFPRPGKVEIIYHPLVKTVNESGDQLSENSVTERIRDIIGSGSISKD